MWLKKRFLQNCLWNLHQNGFICIFHKIMALRVEFWNPIFIRSSHNAIWSLFADIFGLKWAVVEISHPSLNRNQTTLEKRRGYFVLFSKKKMRFRAHLLEREWQCLASCSTCRPNRFQLAGRKRWPHRAPLRNQTVRKQVGSSFLAKF